jgi:rhomboid family GlyGly-CTERM serine protease
VSEWRRFLQLDGAGLIVLSAICVSVLLFEASDESLRVLLRYDRQGLEHGELWRLVTGHLVHLGWQHALLNLAGLGLMWALFFGDYSPRQWLLVLVAAALAIDAGFWFLEPQLAWYVGLSGALHGVMSAGTVAHLKRRDWDAWILLAFVLGKLAWEQTQGALPLSGTEGRLHVVVDAHLYGAFGGFAIALWLRPRLRPL